MIGKHEHLRPVWVLQLSNPDLISAFACDARKTRAADDVADMCGANLTRRPPPIFYDEICRRYRDGTMTNDDFNDHPAYSTGATYERSSR